jgi:hypothetical protein
MFAEDTGSRSCAVAGDLEYDSVEFAVIGFETLYRIPCYECRNDVFV